MSGSVLRLTTQSGSIYEVDRLRKMVKSVRKVPTIAKEHQGKRLPDGEDWKEYQSLNYFGVGHPLYFWWGEGRDERSDELGTPEAGLVLRATWTSPVMMEEILE